MATMLVQAVLFCIAVFTNQNKSVEPKPHAQDESGAYLCTPFCMNQVLALTASAVFTAFTLKPLATIVSRSSLSEAAFCNRVVSKRIDRVHLLHINTYQLFDFGRLMLLTLHFEA